LGSAISVGFKARSLPAQIGFPTPTGARHSVIELPGGRPENGIGKRETGFSRRQAILPVINRCHNQFDIKLLHSCTMP